MKSLAFRLGLCFALGITTLAAHAQTFSCPAGSEDMLNYFVMAYPARNSNFMGPGNSNPVYSTIVPELGTSFADSGYFVWTKSSAGYPWDVKAFDEDYIYDRTTELNWNDPTSFKRFNIDLPLSRRCIATSSGTTIRVISASTYYSSYETCQSYLTQDLGYVKNVISAPAYVQTNGNLGVVKTRQLNYSYGCNSNYANCTDVEVFSMGYQIGLYEWQHFQNHGGKWSMAQESDINEYDSGAATPYLPCSDSYQ